ncbi:MAG: molybdopterin molybdenumtransferase MoeA, partial [Rhodocyclaceae bacterium]|nr:molybdopterin molybdenumtransferase MoeA [Rhodocyclaceae bacterium]
MQANPAPALKPDRQSLSVDDARRAILDGITPIEGWCSVPVRTGLGRVLAEDVIAPFNVPAHDNSAMDGYAVRAADLLE